LRSLQAALAMSVASPVGVALVDAAGRLAEVNPSGRRILDDADGLAIREDLGADAARLRRSWFCQHSPRQKGGGSLSFFSAVLTRPSFRS